MHTEVRMKKLSPVVLLIVLAAIFVSSCSDNADVTINEGFLKYFKNTYSECRDQFREASGEISKKYNGVEIGKFTVPSRVDDDLTIDYCYIPGQKRRDKVVIVTSGVHGIEGYAGSAVETFIMKELMETFNLDNMGILLIHGVNPYGFRYLRRVSENNVDLNRSFSSSRDLYKTENSGYEKVFDLLNPSEKLDFYSFDHLYFPARAIGYVIKYSTSSLRDAILRGQYKYEKGLYFGGKDFEPQKGLMEPLLKKTINQYNVILMIDIHTGYGNRNQLHLFPNPLKDKKKKAVIGSIFEGYKIDWGDEGDFYEVTGDMVTYVGSLVPKTKYFMSMPFEYGTNNNLSTKGSIDSLHNMVAENQGKQYGYDSEEDMVKATIKLVEMYYPSSKAWRSEVIRQIKEILPGSVERYQKVKL